mgnify:FL=1
MSNSNPSESTNEFLTGMGEHIEELRKRLLIAFLTLITAVIASFFFARPLMNWLALPVGGLSALQSIEITENMTAAMNVSLLCGIILASPMVFYQFLAFVLPGLKENEKRMVWLFLPAMILFFLIGALFAFYVILPAAIPFLTSFLGIKTAIRTGSYIKFTTGLMFWIGVSFELPVVIYILAKVGVVNAALLLKEWRIAVVVCAVLAMVITPTTDPVNMMLVMVPLVLLYFLSVLFASFAKKG